ncbi:sigma-70 family RNA polymerase sigma factor [Luteolibacter ambystomatis]|uniref:Sigma-70 family RNA polymerase sigma factor n=1 Tax=Luteolibacter ambystomatis TaxID=2824561 RepID=A0A975PEW0_9BACT|nr:sigma-70 family RNA polymerase sigma factor [Luteolibacter ambystomatis]QUE51683.1 sigma-70 family RNA polymerase sigma factor [Luteolibacter ambystomatis]
MTTPHDEQTREFLSRMVPHQPAIRNFILSIHPQPADLDELMQDVALSLWEKFETYDREREFLPWANSLAYFEVLRFRKKRSRDRLVFSGLVFSEELVALLAEEASSRSLAEPARVALDECLGKLDTNSRTIILARYSRGTSIAELAASGKKSVHSLYRTLEKLRSLLVGCVHRQLAAEGLIRTP